ncbi:MAG: hypothetical protein ACT4PU_01190 [Planctomycetota bacterium]
MTARPERLVRLKWHGPYLLQASGQLCEHPLERQQLPADRGGLYVIHGMNPLLATSSLIYIGETSRLATERLMAHKWLEQEWRVEVYVAPLPDRRLRKQLEALLVYAHQPPSNSKLVANPPRLRQPLRLWNEGRFWGLYPEVSSGHPWNQ